MTLTIVTSYVNYYRTSIATANHTYRLRFLQKLIKLNVPLVIFVSPDCSSVLEQFIQQQPSYSHIRMIQLVHSFFESSYMFLTAVHSESKLELPNNRFIPKDTFDYMCYQHSKVEYMRQVVALNPFQSTHYAWCDYNIFQHWEYPEFLPFIHQYGLPIVTHKPPDESEPSKLWLTQDQLFFPGCWEKATYVMNYLCNNICWRFCGGFFLGTGESIIKLNELYLSHYSKFLDTYGKMVWDVNFWAYLEQETDWDPYVYKADHNRSMLENYPLFALARKPRPLMSLTYTYPEVEHFVPSSGCVISWNGKRIYNVRYVNYRYKADGHCELQPDHKTRTQNKMAYLTNDLTVDDKCAFYTVEEDSMGLPKPDPNEQFQGVEDIRLYRHQDQLKFIATTVNYSGCATNRMIYGMYDILHADDGNTKVSLRNVQVMRPPFPTHKEKNWIPFESASEPNMEYFIYSWNPFRMGVMKEDGALKITHHYTNILPPYFQIRGSSNIVYDDGEYIALVHISAEKTLPKQYFHMLVWLDGTTYKPKKFSKLFYFDKYGPEFCLSMEVTKEHYIFWISRFDRDPVTLFYSKHW